MMTMERLLARCLLVLVVATAFGSAAAAHSLDDVEAMIGGKEKYFQPIDKPAPDFTLRSADGRIVRLADFRNKVVVLHFIYTHCPEIAALAMSGSSALVAINALLLKRTRLEGDVLTVPAAPKGPGKPATARRMS